MSAKLLALLLKQPVSLSDMWTEMCSAIFFMPPDVSEGISQSNVSRRDAILTLQH